MTPRLLIAHRGSWGLCVGLFTMSTTVLAGGNPPAPEGTTSYGAHIITGTVVSADDGDLVLNTSDGHTHEFAFNQAGQYEAAMFPGDHVRVYYEWDQEQGSVAERIQTLNVTQTFAHAEQNDAMLAMSLPPTQDKSSGRSGSEPMFAQAEPASSSQDTQTTSRNLLPATASPIPGIGLVGTVLLAGGGGLRMVRRRGKKLE